MDKAQIESHLAEYMGDRKATSRYASFDYCFNYFQAHREAGRLDDLLDGDAVQLSCLHLGFYLASWGMLRGSTELLQRSARTYVPVIEALINALEHLWTLDVDTYNAGTIADLRAFGSTLGRALHDRASPTSSRRSCSERWVVFQGPIASGAHDFPPVGRLG